MCAEAAQLRERIDIGDQGYHRTATAEMALTVFGSKISARAHEVAGVTPAEVISDWRQRHERAAATFDDAKAAWQHDRTDPGKRAAYNAASMALAAVRNGQDPDTVRDLDRLSTAYRDVLAELRPLGGALDLDARSDRKSADILSEAVTVYPREWIAASNAAHEQRPLRVKATKARAHYARGKTQIGKTRIPDGKVFAKAPDWSPGDEADAAVWEPVEPDVLPLYPAQPGQRLWRRALFDVKGRGFVQDDGSGGVTIEQPRGRGWERHRYVDQRSGRAVEEWRRRRYTFVATSRETVDELLISPRAAAGGCCGTRPGSATAAHEFAHRCEHVVPRIRVAEQAFLRRRTTDADGVRQQVESYMPHLDGEKVRPDGFANRYMGKDYGHGREDAFTDTAPPSAEVMSCGVEAIFAHQHGALLGIGSQGPETGHRADHDSRNFVLGVLACL